ncbi:hypothetical protein [Roseibium sp. RKSG952]|uniref:hypothetical protein n=1 Tax=Roseibium sp. RKSG952 TaxID=2529384 RepID=UPI0012BB9B78|nr:hypothetical protein [Roseibium sp. RKSG952]MTH95304.1 hypothetical protein [Roseibium sp. RKSG952]
MEKSGRTCDHPTNRTGENMPSLREIKDVFESILDDQKEFETKANSVRRLIEMESWELRSRGWGRVTQSVIDHLNFRGVEMEVLREVDKILSLDLEGEIRERDIKIRLHEETLLETASKKTYGDDIETLIQTTINQQKEVEEGICEAEERLAPIRDLSRELELSGLLALQSEEGERFWQSVKDDFFFFGTKRRAAVKTLLAYEAANSLSPAEDEASLEMKIEFRTALDELHKDLQRARTHLKAKERLAKLVEWNPMSDFTEKIASTRIDREAISRVEALFGDDLSDARQNIALGDAIFKLKKEVEKVVTASAETSGLLEEQLSKVKKAIRHRSRKNPDADLDGIRAKVSEQRKALQILLDRLMGFAGRGRDLGRSGNLPVWDGAAYGSFDVFETVMWAAILSDGFSGSDELDIGNLNLEALSNTEAFDPINIGGVDVGSISVPSIDLSVIDTATSGLSSSDFTSSSSFSGGSSFGGGFGD